MPVIHRQSPTQQAPPPKADDGWPDENIKALFYGESGSGKTCLWSTFPGPILVAICSGGRKSGELRSVDTPEMRKKITARRLNSSQQMRDVISECPGKYKTLVLDHVSGLQDLTIKEIKNLDEVPIAKYKIAGKGESWGLVSQQEYGQSALQVKEILRNMLNLDMNVVIIGQERVDRAGAEGDPESILQPSVGVAVTPAIANWLNPAVDYNCQLFKRAKMVPFESIVAGKKTVTMRRGQGVEYCLRVAPHEIFASKFRCPKQFTPELEKLQVIVDPSYDKMMALIRSGKIK